MKRHVRCYASILRFEVYQQILKLLYERIKNKNRFIGTFRTGEKQCSLCCSRLDTNIYADTMSSPYVVLVLRVESKLRQIVTSFSSFEIQLGDTWVMERTLFNDHDERNEWQRRWRPETHFNCLNLGEDVDSCTSKGFRARCEQIYPYILVESARDIQCFDEFPMISPGKRHNHRRGMETRSIYRIIPKISLETPSMSQVQMVVNVNIIISHLRCIHSGTKG
jgi:hypothetical protein